MSGTFKGMCLDSLRANWLFFLIVILCFGLGCLLGTVAVDYLKVSQVNELSAYLDMFIAGADVLKIDSQHVAQTSILNNLLVIAAIYLMGLTVLGIPLILVLLFIRGFAIGFTIGFLAKQKAGQGMLLGIVSLLPHNLFYLPALFIGSVAALSFSILLIRRYFNAKLSVWSGFVGYNIIMIIVCMMAVGAGLVEAYFTPLLIRSTAALLG